MEKFTKIFMEWFIAMAVFSFILLLLGVYDSEFIYASLAVWLSVPFVSIAIVLYLAVKELLSKD